MSRILILLLPTLLLQSKNEPRVQYSMPLGIAPGTKSKVTLRGLRLDGTTEVRAPGATVKILSKSKVAVPAMQKPEKVGDSEVQLELTLPADVAEGELALDVITPGGAAKYKLLVARNVTAEVEPNNGYRQAQAVKLPAVIDGVIGTPLDVDVYRFEGKAKQEIKAEVIADRRGSPLDAVLTLTDERGAILATSDDSVGLDPKIVFTLPRDGVYFLSVIDAHDQGGASHVYRLQAK